MTYSSFYLKSRQSDSVCVRKLAKIKSNQNNSGILGCMNKSLDVAIQINEAKSLTILFLFHKLTHS